MRGDGSSAGRILQQIEYLRKNASAKGRWHTQYRNDTEKKPRN